LHYHWFRKLFVPEIKVTPIFNFIFNSFCSTANVYVHLCVCVCVRVCVRACVCVHNTMMRRENKNINSGKASGEFVTLLAQCCPRSCHDRVLFEDLLSEPEEIPFWQSLIYENNSLLLSTGIKGFNIYHLICTWYNFHLRKKLVKMPPCQRNVHIIWLKTCRWCHGNLVCEIPAFNLFWKYRSQRNLTLKV